MHTLLEHYKHSARLKPHRSTSDILAANLSHDHHESNRSNVGALAAHVAAGDDLETRLLC